MDGTRETRGDARKKQRASPPSPTPLAPAGREDLGGTSLADWTRARAKSFKVVSEKRDADGPTTDRALEIVRRFISERGLILYGGLAIDYALRLRGDSIYPEHARPDYDFFSPRSVDDAYELAEILNREGFPNVGAHTALHVQTMRVKFDFVFVADISYAPPEVFERLPTFDYGGIRVLHPDYQRLDMHLAFCFPYNSPPREDIYHRLRKDLGRFNLFEKYYPLGAGGLAADLAGAGSAGDSRGGGSAGVAAEPVDLERVALHGFAAYGLVRQALAALAKAASSADVPVPDAARPGLAAPTVAVIVTASAAAASAGANRPARVVVAPPAGPPPTLSFASPWPRLVVKDLEVTGRASGNAAADAAVEWFDPIMDSRPVMGRLPASGAGGGAVEIYSTERRLLSVFRTRASPRGPEVTVVSPQYLLLDLLHRAHSSSPDSAARRVYLAFYRHTLDVLAAGEAYAEAVRGSRSGASEAAGEEGAESAYRQFVRAGPFGFPAATLGSTNHDPAYLSRLSKSARALRDPPPAGYDPAGLPPGYYFNQGRGRPSFPDYGANAAYRRAGARRESPPA